MISINIPSTSDFSLSLSLFLFLLLYFSLVCVAVVFKLCVSNSTTRPPYTFYGDIMSIDLGHEVHVLRPMNSAEAKKKHVTQKNGTAKTN